MLTAETVRELLDYEPETGVFRWLSDAANGRTKKGTVAGSLSRSGYRRIKLNRSRYQAHRLAWLYVYGEWPSDEIDHINALRDDNRIENLRIASRSQNRANSKSRRAGLKGAYKGRSGFTAVCRGRYIGHFDTAEEAHAAYCAAAEKHFGEFARFE